MAALWVSAPESSPGREALVEAEEARHDHRGGEPGHGADDRQRDGLDPALAQRLQELRTDRIADAEEEEQEQERLGGGRDGNLGDLADGETGEQRPGDGSEREPGELHAADQVAERDREEHGELGIGDRGNPLHAASEALVERGATRRAAPRVQIAGPSPAQVRSSTMTRPQSVSSVLLTA